MSRRLLDTNVISNVTKPRPSEALVAWMAEQTDEDLFISSLTIAEVRRRILEKPDWKKAPGRCFAAVKGEPCHETAGDPHVLKHHSQLESAQKIMRNIVGRISI